MDNYQKIKSEIEKLQINKDKLQKKKIDSIIPLYEIVISYKNQLGNILPRNINSVSSKNLELRMSVLEEEVKDLELESTIKNNILEKITKIKHQVVKINEEQDFLNQEIKNMSPLLDKRKNYVLEKSEEKQKIEERINKLQEQIAKKYEFLELKEWEYPIRKNTQTVIESYWEKLNEENNKLNQLVSEDGLLEDIEFLLNGTNKKKESDEKEKTEQEQKFNEVKQEVIVPDAMGLSEEQKKEWSNFEISEFIEEEKEPVEKVITDLDKTILPSVEDKVNDSEEVISSTKNEVLEEKLKTTKKNRIALGIHTILTKIKENKEIKVKEEKNKETLKQASLLVKEVRETAKEKISYFTQEEVNFTVKLASEINKKLRKIKETNEYTQEEIDLIDKKVMELDNYLEPIRTRIEEIENQNIKIRVR